MNPSSRPDASRRSNRAHISPRATSMKRREKHGGILGSSTRNKGSVRMKVEKLQKLVPGGDDLQTERLLSHTADYIVRMRFQVNLLQALLKLHHP
ncbi:hypothetical protein MLD38_032734 [Melastoma candidum]|uniref:Uncharacterized protein n=1 Tax=Melastoma candidum TaxID=119954 RepID=A0ACB9M6B2_9MYRT|nr:hypothetical protein MLD38_032734 [Melastoma candidum]